jgi:hypothetical protein
MRTDTVLKQDGMRILSDNLGLVEAERFISLVIREPFDYTEWQRSLYKNISIEELCEKADTFWNETHM